MALTTAVEIDLKEASFIQGFEDDKALWLEMAQEAYNYTVHRLDDPKRDDVSPHLALALETQPAFRSLRASKRLSGRRWSRDFADLVIERTWQQLTKDNNDGGG